MKKLLREPLVHFLGAGLALFVLFGVVNSRSSSSEGDVITVDREALLSFIQYRIKAFDSEAAERRLGALSDEELERLVDDYVREEVLHREALALGLDRDDYVIRRRLVQKIEFITEGFAEATADVDEVELRRYFEAHRSDYYVEPYVTFTHVFFDAERRSRQDARTLAEKKLDQLNREGVPFSEAPKHGDRFVFHLNYVERTPDYVASHFGPEMARAVFAMEPNDFVWRGPFESEYGAHLVLLITNEPGREPALAEIEDQVRDDARQAAIRAATERAIDEIIDAYEVRVVYSREKDDAVVAGAAADSP